MGKSETDFDFIIRMASPDDVGANDSETLRSLIQELADTLQMSNGPKLNSDQLRQFLKDGAANALIATASKGNEIAVAGYAIYYVAPSTHFGKVFFLEDLYIRPNFRRKKLGSHFMSRLNKIFENLSCDVMQWNVLASNINAIRFYISLGAQDLTNKNGSVGPLCWRIDSTEYETLIRSSEEYRPDIKFTVLALDTVNEETAMKLMECWHSLDISFQPTVAEMTFIKKHRFFGLRVIQAQSIREDTILGMVLFHNCAFSTWLGPYLTIDNMRVRENQRRQGIGKKLVAELAKVCHGNIHSHKLEIAVYSNYPRISWMADASSEMKAFFKSLGAVNLTEKEGWLLFQLTSKV